MIVYKITNKSDGKMYVGQTVQSLQKRWRQHRSDKTHCIYLYRAIKKYGKDNFLVEEIIKCNSMEEMNSKEVFYIKELNTLAPNGYNLRTGGDNSLHSEESKTRMRKPKSAEHCNNMSKSQKGKPGNALGSRRTDETKKLMSKAQEGNTNNLGHKHTEHTKQKQSLVKKGENNPGAKLSREQVDLIRELYKTNCYMQKELASLFGVSAAHMNHIVTYKAWII